MILDRVDFVSGFAAGLSTETVRGVEYAGIRQNSIGMTCFAYRAPGKKHSTLLEVGWVRRIEADGRTFVAPRYESWRKRVEEIEAFMSGGPVAVAPSVPLIQPAPAIAQDARPWWRRLFG